MGVFGLKRYATSAKQLRECSDFLAELSDVTLAVDFNGFLYFVCEKLCEQVQPEQAASGDPPTGGSPPTGSHGFGCWQWLLLGGCTLRLELFLTNWLSQLNANRIKLVFVQDPPSCFGGKDHRKASCLVQRTSTRIANVQELLKLKQPPIHQEDVAIQTSNLNLLATATTTELLKKTNMLFPFARQALQTLLRQHQIPLTTSKREADEDLAQLVRDNHAFAVLADDSDFLCMRGVRYIPFDCLRVQTNSDKVTARVFSPDKVASSLGIAEDQLMDLVLLCSNDLTPLLDEKYEMAKKLHFPDLRQKPNAVLPPERASEWIRNNMQEGFSVLENPVLAEIESQNDGFLASLYEIYRFYGYSSQFLAKFHIKVVKPLAKKTVRRYLELLDVMQYPQFAIDLMETQSRRLGIRFDVLALDSSPYSSQNVTVQALTRPLRAICYRLLNLDFVEETKYNWTTNAYIVERVEAAKWDPVGDKLKHRNAKTKHSLTRVEDALKSMIQWFLFGTTKYKEAASFCSMGKSLEEKEIGNALASVVLLWKCDQLLAGGSPGYCLLLNDFWMDVLLITSVICLKRTNCDFSSDHSVKWGDASLLNWQMCGVASGFLEVMGILKQVRVFLGEINPQGNWPHGFSAEVYFAVVSIVINFRQKHGTQAQPLGLSKKEVKMIFDSFQDQLKSTEVEGTTWRLFWNASSNRKALQKLVLEQSSARQEDSCDADSSSPDEDRGEARLDLVGGKFVGASTVENLELDLNGMRIVETSPVLLSSGKKKKSKKTRVKPKKTTKLMTSMNGEVLMESHAMQHVNQPSETTMIIPPSPMPSDLPTPPFFTARGLNSSPRKHEAPALTPPIVMKMLGKRVQQPTSSKTRRVLGSQSNEGISGDADRRQVSARSRKESPMLLMNGHCSGSDGMTTTDGFQSDELHHVSSRKSSQERVKLHHLMSTLPVYQHREEILDALKMDQLLVIQGETGCGKSTSVPQFILDDYFDHDDQRSSADDRRPSIYVTQPRRVAAIELASTVAKMRKDKDVSRGNALGQTIGYRIGQKQMTSRATCITYVTTGYMVERLVHEPESLRQLTHLVLDEVHERSMDVDLLLLLIRLLLVDHPHVKLIIMSATMDAKVILKYFQESLPIPMSRKKALFVGSKLFPVRQVFLDQLTQFFPRLQQESKDLQHLVGLYDKLIEMGPSAAKSSGALTKRIANIYTDQLQLIVRMTCFLIDTFMIAHQNANDATESGATQYVHKPSILIFLPGIMGIQQLHEEFSTLQRTRYHDRRMKLFVLHSDMEIEHQQAAFESIDEIPDFMAKVILSTNIAESSVTIPDVTHVINCGLEKQIVMPDSKESHTEVLVNEWCSRASTQQRSGRAGRVMPGMAFHLFPQRFHDDFMREYTVPELLRTPLDRILLILKAKLTAFGVPSALLQKAMDQPDQSNIDGAYKLLYEMDAIETDKETSGITMFGRFACHLPLDLQLSRLILNSLWFAKTRSTTETFGLVTDMVILVSILAVPDLFRMPSRFHTTSALEYMDEMKINLRSKLAVDNGMWSDPMSMWKHYKAFIAQHQDPNNKPSTGSWVRQFAFSFRRYQALNFMIAELCGRLRALSRQAEFCELCWSPQEMALLQSLDTYASSGSADNTLLGFAQKEDTVSEQFVRLLLVHNYSDNMISSDLPSPQKNKKKNAKSSAGKSRVLMRLADENAVAFAALQQDETRQMFGRCCLESDKELVQLERPGADHISLTFVETGVGDFNNSKNQIALRSACFPVSLLYYIRDQRFPIDFAMDKAEATPTFRFRLQACDGNDQVLTWRLQRNGCKVSIKSRSLLTLPCRAVFSRLKGGVEEDGDDQVHAATVKVDLPSKLYGVFTDRLYTGDETRMYCGKCTLLPLDSTVFYPLMLLLGAGPKANIWVYGQVENTIAALKVNGQSFAFPALQNLDWKVLALVNMFRLEFSLALLGKQANQAMMSHDSVASIEDLMAIFEDSASLVQLSKSQRSKTLSWIRLDYVQEDLEMFRYPRFEL